MTLPKSMGNPTWPNTFEATHQAALQRLDASDSATNARRRNALDGVVTGLSPYFAHGLLSLQDAARAIHVRHTLGFDDKLVFEFGWHGFFHHM